MTDTMIRPPLAVRATREAATMAGRNLRHTLRSPDTMIMTLAVPIMILLMFVYVFGGAMRVDGHYIDYVVPGIILLCAGFGSGTTAVGVCTDMRNGIIDRIRTLAVRRTSMLVGHVADSVLRNLFTTALVVLVAVAIGFRPTADPVRWLGVLGVVALFVLALSWLAAALGLLAANPEAANGFTFAYMFLPYVSSAFVPPDTMPVWLRWFAENQPITPITETIRGLLIGTPTWHDAGAAVGWCAGIAVAGYLLAGALLRHRTRD
ncbi:ABC transporter permease [Nocardia aurantia]|uniref:Transport permease protein n=1 Tax=Nocardia aurantia TaxID=2585199 RepID=A0A7K0DZA8_9NOCA|nr:ABC transporter permease [Nocardia aurantia]MQY31146.1 Daunorubicin/doxorubicin resistance ABC transporter permease protein DrrB [Nocardia aurantia]